MGRGSGIRVRGTAIQVSFYWRGQRFQKTLKLEPTKQNLKYAERLRSSILLEIAQGTFDPSKYFRKQAPPSSPLHVKDALESWLASIERNTAVSTLRDYKSAVTFHLIPAFGHLELGQLTTSSIRMWIGTLKNITNKRINNILTPLRGMLADAFHEGTLNKNPMDRIKNLPLLEEPAGRLVPEIVKGKVRQEKRIRLFPLLFAFLLVDIPGEGNSLAKRLRNRMGLNSPDLSVDSSGDPLKNSNSGHCKRNDPLFPILRLRKRHRPLLVVHQVPGHPCQLSLSHGRFDGERNKIG